MINTFLLTHAPKTSDWYFAWQSGYGDMAPKVEFEFSGAIKKKSCGISIKWVLFLASIRVGDLSWISSVHNFEFPGVSSLYHKPCHLLPKGDNHILKFFTEDFENLPSSSENEQCIRRLHLYFPFEICHSDIHNKMADNNGTALPSTWNRFWY